MSDQSIISRRDALLAAASLGTAVAVADAGDLESPFREEKVELKPVAVPAQFKLSITLTDGQVVTFNAIEAVVDFGGNAQLLVKPTGVMPTIVARPRANDQDGFSKPGRI